MLAWVLKFNVINIFQEFISLRAKNKSTTYFFFLGNPPLSNPYGDPNLSQPIMALQQNVADILFVRTSYVKKIIEDCSNSEETIKLFRFCCWENPQFSSTVLSELLWQVKTKKSKKMHPMEMALSYCCY